MNVSSRGHDYKVSILVIGDSYVGKTSFLLRFCEESFEEDYKATIGVDLQRKTIGIDDKRALIEVWDTTGQERFAKLASSYYKRAMGIILSYAVNDRKSFERVEFWMNQVQQHSLENTRKILIATKTDLPREEKMVGFDEGKTLAGKYGIQFFETSSKTGLNVKESFCAIAKEVIEKNSKCKQRGGSNQENNSTKPNKDEKNMKLNASSIKNKSSKGGCC